MSSSGFGMNGNGNGQFPSGQGTPTPYPTWMSVNHNNHVNFFMYGNGGPAPPGVSAPVAQPHVEPPTGHWPHFSMGQIHQQQAPIPAFGMPQPHHGQVNSSWNGHNAQSAFQGLQNPGIFGEHSSGQLGGNNGVGTRFITIVPLFDKLSGMDGNGGQGGGGMGGFGGGAGAGSFGF